MAVCQFLKVLTDRKPILLNYRYFVALSMSQTNKFTQLYKLFSTLSVTQNVLLRHQNETLNS